MPSALALLRSLPPVVQILIAGTFVNKMGSFIIPYLTLVLRREFLLEEGQIGSLLFAYGAGSMASILAGGSFTDHLGRRFTLLLSLFGSGVLAVAMGVTTSVRTFVPLLVLFGFVADLYRPAASSIIGDVLASSQRAAGFAALRTAINLGFAVGMTLGGLLADWSWRLLFFGDGATTLLFGALVYARIPETRPAPAEDERAGKVEGPWRDGVFLQLVFVSFVFALIFFSHITTLPLTVTVAAGYPARVFGLLVAVNGVLIALLEIAAVAHLRSFRRLRVAAVGTLLTGLGFGLTGFALHWAWFLLTVVLWTAGEILSAPLKLAFLSDWAPPRARGRYLSWYGASWSLALGLNPIIFLPLHAALGERAFWPIMLVLALPAAFILLRLDREADRPERLRGVAADGRPTVPPALATPGPEPGA